MSKSLKILFLIIFTEGKFWSTTLNAFLRTGFLKLFNGILAPPNPEAQFFAEFDFFTSDEFSRVFFRVNYVTLF